MRDINYSGIFVDRKRDIEYGKCTQNMISVTKASYNVMSFIFQWLGKRVDKQTYFLSFIQS